MFSMLYENLCLFNYPTSKVITTSNIINYGVVRLNMVIDT